MKRGFCSGLCRHHVRVSRGFPIPVLQSEFPRSVSVSLMKVGSLDHDGERERTVEHRSSTSHGCIYRARDGERESDENGSEKAAAA